MPICLRISLVRLRSTWPEVAGARVPDRRKLITPCPSKGCWHRMFWTSRSSGAALWIDASPARAIRVVRIRSGRTRPGPTRRRHVPCREASSSRPLAASGVLQRCAACGWRVGSSSRLHFGSLASARRFRPGQPADGASRRIAVWRRRADSSSDSAHRVPRTCARPGKRAGRLDREVDDAARSSITLARDPPRPCSRVLRSRRTALAILSVQWRTL